MNTILVPTDFSTLSENALDFAVELARYAVADVKVIHFVEIIHEENLLVTGDTSVVATTDETLFNIQVMRSNKKKLQKIEEQYSEDSINVSAELADGGFLKGIQEFVRKNEVSAAVIGTTGEQNIQEFFSGNHTEQLIEHLNVPVVSLQKKVEFNKVKEVVVAFDVSDELYSPAALARMKDALLNFNAHISMVTVVAETKKQEVALASLQDLQRRMGLGEASVDVLVGNDVEKELDTYAQEKKAGVFALLTEAKSGLWRLVQNSLASHVTKDFEIPVLTLNKKYFE